MLRDRIEAKWVEVFERAFRLSRVEPGDEVVVPSYTFIACATSVLLAGATPVIADVDPEHHACVVHQVRMTERVSERVQARRSSGLDAGFDDLASPDSNGAYTLRTASQ